MSKKEQSKLEKVDEKKTDKKSSEWDQVPYMLIILPLLFGFLKGWDFSKPYGVAFRFGLIAIGVGLLVYKKMKRAA